MASILDLILEVDIYRKKQDELCRILGQYNIEAPIKDYDTSQDTLRPLAAKLKALVRVAKTNSSLEKLLSIVLSRERELTEEEKRRFPTLEDFQADLKDRDKAFTEQVSTENSENSDPDDLVVENEYENEHDYESLDFSNNSKASTSTVSNYLNPIQQPTASNRITQVSLFTEVKQEQAHNNIINQDNHINLIMPGNKEKLPLISAGNFSGLLSENVIDFIDKYELAALSNNWSDDNLIKLFPAHLSGTALYWFKNYKTRNQNPTWNEIKTEFKKTFTPVALADNLDLIMERKIQGEHENSMNYFVDVVATCRRYEPQIQEKKIIYYVLQGLKPQICKYVSTLENSTLAGLEENLLKAEAYILTTQRNREKYDREQTRNNTTFNREIQAPKDTKSLDLHDELAELKTMVANLELTSRQSRSRDRNPKGQNRSDERDRSKSSDRNRNFSRRDNRTRFEADFTPSSGSSNRDRYKKASYDRSVDRSQERSNGFVRGGNRNYTPRPSYDTHYYQPRPYYNHPPTNMYQDPSFGHCYPLKPMTNYYGRQNYYQNTPNHQNKYCQICNRSGHNLNQCFFNKRAANDSNRGRGGRQDHNRPKCDYCGRFNHLERDCFHKKRNNDPDSKNV